MIRQKTFPGLMLMLIFLIAPGCGSSIYDSLENKETDEALAFETSKRLDEGDYAYVLAQGATANPEDYAVAAMGIAGIEVPTLITALTDNPDTSSIDPIFEMSDNPDSLDELVTSQASLEAALVADPGNAALELQLQMVSLSVVTTSIAQVADNESISGVDTSDGLDPAEQDLIAAHLLLNPSTKIDSNGDGTNDMELSAVITDSLTSINSTDTSGTSGLDSSVTGSTDTLDPEGDGVTNADIAAFLVL